MGSVFAGLRDNSPPSGSSRNESVRRLAALILITDCGAIPRRYPFSYRLCSLSRFLTAAPAFLWRVIAPLLASFYDVKELLFCCCVPKGGVVVVFFPLFVYCFLSFDRDLACCGVIRGMSLSRFRDCSLTLSGEFASALYSKM